MENKPVSLKRITIMARNKWRKDPTGNFVTIGFADINYRMDLGDGTFGAGTETDYKVVTYTKGAGIKMHCPDKIKEINGKLKHFKVAGGEFGVDGKLTPAGYALQHAYTAVVLAGFKEKYPEVTEECKAYHDFSWALEHDEKGENKRCQVPTQQTKENPNTNPLEDL